MSRREFNKSSPKNRNNKRFKLRSSNLFTLSRSLNSNKRDKNSSKSRRSREINKFLSIRKRLSKLPNKTYLKLSLKIWKTSEKELLKNKKKLRIENSKTNSSRLITSKDKRERSKWKLWRRRKNTPLTGISFLNSTKRDSILNKLLSKVCLRFKNGRKINLHNLPSIERTITTLLLPIIMKISKSNSKTLFWKELRNSR